MHGLVDKIKYHNIFDRKLRYRYCNKIVEMTVGAATKYLHNEIFHKKSAAMNTY